MMQVLKHPNALVAVEDVSDMTPVEEWDMHSQLFSASLVEVLKMLDNGAFMRWKCSDVRIMSPFNPSIYHTHIMFSLGVFVLGF